MNLHLRSLEKGINQAAKTVRNLTRGRLPGLLIACLSFALFMPATHAQKITQQIQESADRFSELEATQLLTPAQNRSIQSEGLTGTVEEATFFDLQSSTLQDILLRKPEHLVLELELVPGETARLLIMKSEALASGFKVTLASNPDQPFDYTPGLYYWGIIEGQDASLVALAISETEVMGIIQDEQQNYTLGLLEGQTDALHILYPNDALQDTPGISCHVDDDEHYIGSDSKEVHEGGGRANNCVQVYVEVDYDIVVGKGGVTQAANYVLGAFSQVSILYANDNIELVVSELLVWDVADPYTGPSTSNYLTQFRNYQNGNYNGDIAHLVGYAGGGGIAYLDVLCNSYYAVGYSAINSTYNNVPTYSWTVMVLAHEIGHNLGSQHTHACAWNGNNTAIDGCGAAAGYSEGCTGPIPSEGGTIMSYCHLNNVGINLNLGFGPQPGDRIRGKITNAPCLSSCAPPVQFDAGITAIVAPVEFPCENNLLPIVSLENFGAETLTSVSIQYQVGSQPAATYNWTGSLASGSTTNVTLPSITYSPGTYTFSASTSQPNGQQDENAANDGSSTSFTYIAGYCDCIETIGALQPNPLTHAGNGSSSASLSLLAGSKNVSFLISGLSFKNNGSPQTRFDDLVTVTYVDGNGNPQTYGSFLGSQQGSVSVNINGFVNSVNVSLANALNNNYNSTQSVSFSDVNYCGTGEEPPCNDSDNDGVCDEDDVCPGFDDNLIGTACDDGDPCTINDVYTANCICEGAPNPDCGGGGCVETIFSNFPQNPLSHQGAGSAQTSINFPSGNSDVSFTISNMDSRLNGNPGNRYDDQVTVSYTDGNGNNQVYGVFLGSLQSSVSVNINGQVQSVTVSLTNGYAANSVQVSVSMSTVESCLPGAPAYGSMGNAIGAELIEIYPNPSSGTLFLRLEKATNADVQIFSAQGMLISQHQMREQSIIQLDLHQVPVTAQLIFVAVRINGAEPIVRPVVLQR